MDEIETVGDELGEDVGVEHDDDAAGLDESAGHGAEVGESVAFVGVEFVGGSD